ncbi:MAG: ribose-5-phosphate isomerase RpiA [Rhizobiales bacterium]|nr:ribose-5-phosphate isomerase RpiA [Hyphomicrobiales bacterium]
MPTADELKQMAALAALEKIEGGMKLGLGSGSTANHFVKALGARVRDGLDIIGVPTSERTAQLAKAEGIRLTTLDEVPALDLTVDGADELDEKLRLIKGGGGALLREKIVAAASRRMIVIADDSKLVPHLGAFPLPIEVNLFGLRATRAAIEAAAYRFGQPATLTRRLAADGSPFVTDGGHAIIDASFGLIRDPEGLSLALSAIPGVVEHGLFIGLATSAAIATPDGVRWLHA